MLSKLFFCKTSRRLIQFDEFSTWSHHSGVFFPLNQKFPPEHWLRTSLAFLFWTKRICKTIIIECTRTHFFPMMFFPAPVAGILGPMFGVFGIPSLSHGWNGSSTQFLWWLVPTSELKPEHWVTQLLALTNCSPRIALIPNVEVIETVGQMCWNHQKVANHDDEVAVLVCCRCFLFSYI